ncbi:MAG: 6-carboxytetrahydropterin synthase [Bacteroidetes bacterium]|nr:6-carboxytetrahydropterin synthase [Bacteroidota bacterium]MDA1121748.1 6-carboxytetrahydropterin synthase [Bacteroidota bacterium]
MMPKVFVSRKEHFNSAHKLFNPTWSKQRNIEVFGPCANDNWHGHNFELIVTVEGFVNQETGFVIDMKELSVMVQALVIKQLDHKNLNLDVAFMKDKLASCENIVTEIWKILEEPIAKLSGDVNLYRLILRETSKNHVEYRGPDSES